MHRTAIAIHQLVLSNTPQPDELLFACQPGEIILLQGCCEDLEQKILGVLQRRCVESQVGKDARGIALIERRTCTIQLWTFFLLLHAIFLYSKLPQYYGRKIIK